METLELILGYVGIFVIVVLSIGLMFMIVEMVSEFISDRKSSPFEPIKDRWQALTTKYETYHVVRVHYNDDNDYEYHNLIYIEEGGIRVPITCKSEDKKKIRQMQRLNKEHEVYIKAKIDQSTLELVKVKGYTVK